MMIPFGQHLDTLEGLDSRPSADDFAELFVGPNYRSRFRPAGLGRVFHVSVYPSFGDYLGYELLRDTGGEGDGWFLSQRTWRRFSSRPGARAASSVVAVVSSFAEPWVTVLRSFHAPLAFGGQGGLDGTMYEIARGDELTSIRLRWWGDGPSEWAPLTTWARSFLEAAGALDGWELLPPSLAWGALYSVYALLPPNGANAAELTALRKLFPALADISISELRRCLQQPEGVFLVKLPWPRARELQDKATALGLRFELRPVLETPDPLLYLQGRHPGYKGQSGRRGGARTGEPQAGSSESSR
jgi:hypothetical protein